MTSSLAFLLLFFFVSFFSFLVDSSLLLSQSSKSSFVLRERKTKSGIQDALGEEPDEVTSSDVALICSIRSNLRGPGLAFQLVVCSRSRFTFAHICSPELRQCGKENALPHYSIMMACGVCHTPFIPFCLTAYFLSLPLFHSFLSLSLSFSLISSRLLPFLCQTRTHLCDDKVRDITRWGIYVDHKDRWREKEKRRKIILTAGKARETELARAEQRFSNRWQQVLGSLLTRSFSGWRTRYSPYAIEKTPGFRWNVAWQRWKENLENLKERASPSRVYPNVDHNNYYQLRITYNFIRSVE